MIEIVVWPSPLLADDEVRFELTALPHIVWNKQLRIVCNSGSVTLAIQNLIFVLFSVFWAVRWLRRAVRWLRQAVQWLCWGAAAA